MTIISFNGIERINKQYYSGIINKYLKEMRGHEHIKKFSFPSYTTQTGSKLAALIRKFKTQDLIKTTSLSKSRYRKIAEYMLNNYQEYYRYIDLHNSSDKNNISIINNNYFSVIAHSLAINIDYKIIEHLIRDYFSFLVDEPRNTLAIFLVTNDVKKVLTEPPKSHEIYIKNREDVLIEPDIVSIDYINFFKQVDNYYRQMFVTYSHCRKFKGKINPALIEIDVHSNDYITNTVAAIKDKVNEFLLESPNPIIPAINKK